MGEGVGRRVVAGYGGNKNYIAYLQLNSELLTYFSLIS
jgi:hypothetical protein